MRLPALLLVIFAFLGCSRGQAHPKIPGAPRGQARPKTPGPPRGQTRPKTPRPPRGQAHPKTPRAPRPSARASCRHGAGAWSKAVHGLRGRLRTARAEQGSLQIIVELQNVTHGETLGVHWVGYLHSFASFHLDGPAGEVPAPDWRLGGNAFSGRLCMAIPHGETVRHIVGVVGDGPYKQRIVRIGAFWARPLPPPGGGTRALRAVVTGGKASADEFMVHRSSDGVATRVARPGNISGRAWTGSLRLPGVCID